MRYQFIFSVRAEKSFKKLSSVDQNRVKKKLIYLKSVPDIQNYLEDLQGFSHATHRIRIGNIRLILMQKNETDFLVVDIGYRGDIYK